MLDACKELLLFNTCCIKENDVSSNRNRMDEINAFAEIEI